MGEHELEEVLQFFGTIASANAERDPPPRLLQNSERAAGLSKFRHAICLADTAVKQKVQ